MRILDQDTDTKVNQVALFLTTDEAQELRDTLADMLERPTFRDHRHISTEDFQKEITLAIYVPGKVDGFHERAKRLILEDV